MFFLSHAGSDAASALALATGLKTAGLDVWCDQRPRAMEGGQPFIEQLEHKLRESTAFLLLVGKRGVDRWVRAEVDVALNRQVKEPSYRIVPLLLAGTTAERLPPFLARFHALSLDGDVTRWGRTEFQALAEHVRSFASRLAVHPDTCPFPGLESFGRKEARFFFGRDQELREALAKLGREKGVYRRWLAVEGASGSGKSSFVKAGLVPAIRGGWVEGAPRRWRVAEMRPGKNATHQLARALVHAFRKKDAPPDRVTRVEEALRHETGLRDFIALELKEGWGLLLVLDQLEEVFTLSEGSPDESRHLEALLVKALEGDSPFHLITTIRSDFLGHMSELPLLSKALNARWTSRYLLGPMNEQGLREAILAPAQMAGLSFEEELPERILKDTRESTRVAGEALPLVAHVLLELWKRRSKQVLTHAAYGELGGVGGALTQSADALLNTFTEEEQELVRKLMLSLVKVGRGEQDVRRTLTHEEAVRAAGRGNKGRGILTRLSGGRAPDEPVGSPAPPRLLSVSAERVDLVHEALLSKWQTLQDWLKKSREALERQDDLEAAARLWKATGALPSGAQLEYLKSAEPVSQLAREFLEKGRRVALARALVTHAQGRPGKGEPQLSLRLLLEAWRLDPGEQTATALLDWYQKRPRLRLSGHSFSVSAACFSPDGQRLLTASYDPTARLWEASSGKLLAQLLGHSDLVNAACFSPDGQRLLTASDDHTARLWDASSGKPLAQFFWHSDSVNAACFSPDGQRVLTASHDHTARLWDASSGKLLAQFLGHSDWVNTACFSPDGQRVLTASGDHTARLWEASSGKLLVEFLGHSYSVNAACFSPDGQRVLTVSEDKTARLWEASSGKLLAEFLGHSDSVRTACFSPDGRRVLTASEDKTARLWGVYELCAPVEELVELAQTMARELSEEEWRLYLGAE